MRTYSCSACRLLPIAIIAIAWAPLVWSQGATCPAVKERDATAAETAYAQGNYAEAEDLYAQAVAQQPHEERLAAALAQTRLREGKIAQAAGELNTLISAYPHSAVILTALAEVQLRQGQPWLAMETLRSAAAADPCYAREHLIRSRILRIDSMYSSERKELQSAYDIDPKDPDIRRAWQRSVALVNDIAGVKQSLAAGNKLDPEVQRMGEASVPSMMLLLSENSETCQIQPVVTSATLPLLASMQDGKHVDAYRLQVQLRQTKAALQVDTAASGLYISRALADANGLKQGEGAPPGTVHADSVRMGPLEFRDCTLGVSETPFAGKADGYIGTDMFASYLITLDYARAKLLLAPLPPKEGSIPGDRLAAQELRDFVPVYHKQQYLLIPVLLNNKERRLFVLDSGIRFSAMSPDVAHVASTTRLNFTNAMQTTSGATVQVYRDSFDFEFANVLLRNRSHVLELDTSAMERSAGMKVSGMLGFDMLHAMTLHLDYRDGLVKFDPAAPDVAQVRSQENAVSSFAPHDAPSSPVCEDLGVADLPITSTLGAVSTGVWDSGHMKVGEAISAKVAQGGIFPSCRLDPGMTLYGHVTAVSKKAGEAQLGIEFDRGDCFGKGKKPLTLRIIGLVVNSGEFKAEHNSIPIRVTGGGRQLGAAVAALGNAYDQNLNPGGALNTVHPGIVVGAAKLKLSPEGGPACSTLLSSTDRSVRLGLGTEFVVMLESTPQ